MLVRVSSLATSLALACLAACDGGSDPLPGSEPVTTSPIARQLQEVFVSNTANAPVPTAAVGTTQVAGAVTASQGGAWNVTVDNAQLAVTGAVAATQAGNWNVNVAGGAVAASQAGAWAVAVDSLPPVALAQGTTVDVGSMPPVQISGTPSVNIVSMPAVAVSGAVTIANGAGSPVPVKVTSPVQTRWQMAEFFDIGPGTFGRTANCFTVPAGKRLVIEHVTATFHNAGHDATYADVSTHVGGRFVNHNFPAIATGASGTRSYAGLAHRTELHADAGTHVGCGASRAGSSGTVNMHMALSGYLIDL